MSDVHFSNSTYLCRYASNSSLVNAHALHPDDNYYTGSPLMPFTWTTTIITKHRQIFFKTMFRFHLISPPKEFSLKSILARSQLQLTYSLCFLSWNKPQISRHVLMCLHSKSLNSIYFSHLFLPTSHKSVRRFSVATNHVKWLNCCCCCFVNFFK